MEKGEKKLIDDIEQIGWHVLKVLEDDKGPGFAYSVGLYKTFGHPEIVIVGLKLDLAHILINNLGEDLKNGKWFRAGQMYEGIHDDFECLMVDVDKGHYKKYFGYGLWYYQGDDFPVLQCLYPTVNGIYLWEEDWPEDIKKLQPILGDVGMITKE